MKRVALFFVVCAFVLTTMLGCSEYIAPNGTADTGETITPEQMVEISKEMQQTVASPDESSAKESSLAEAVQTEDVTVASGVIESPVVTPVQTEASSIDSAVIDSSAAELVQPEVTPVDSTTVETSYIRPTPADSTASSGGSTGPLQPSVTTVVPENETPVVPLDTANSSSSDTNSQTGTGQLVYWTPGGSVWHVTDKCSSLSRSKEIVSGSIASAQAAGKDRVCKRCG